MKNKLIVLTSTLIVVVTVIVACSKKSKATCSDGILNQNEIIVDCGGVCGSCGTCSDGVKNQNETNVDCGGICYKCATCSDGIQNQGETGIDCGGPCSTCPIIYPATGAFGVNVLKKDTTNIVSSGGIIGGTSHPYSLVANLPVNTSLKVVIKETSNKSGLWGYVVGSSVGWAIGTFNNSVYSQTLTATGQVNTDVRFYFYNNATAVIDIYENGATTPTRTKNINW